MGKSIKSLAVSCLEEVLKVGRREILRKSLKKKSSRKSLQSREGEVLGKRLKSLEVLRLEEVL